MLRYSRDTSSEISHNNTWLSDRLFYEMTQTICMHYAGRSERERDRDRETDRQRDRETDRQRQRQTDRQTEKAS